MLRSSFLKTLGFVVSATLLGGRVKAEELEWEPENVEDVLGEAWTYPGHQTIMTFQAGKKLELGQRVGINGACQIVPNEENWVGTVMAMPINSPGEVWVEMRTRYDEEPVWHGN